MLNLSKNRVVFDLHMKMENQIQSVGKSVNSHLQSINSVHNSLTDKVTARQTNQRLQHLQIVVAGENENLL